MSAKRVFLFLLLTNILFSQELENIMSDLNQYSDKTNLNIDYKPTAMTVLYASDLESFGINTLGEALDFIPGIQTYSGTAFAPFISVRILSPITRTFSLDLIQKLYISGYGLPK